MKRAISLLILLAVLSVGCATPATSTVRNAFHVISRPDGATLHIILCNTSPDDIFLEVPQMGLEYSVEFADSTGKVDNRDNGQRVDLLTSSWRFLKRNAATNAIIYGSTYESDIALPAEGKVRRVVLLVRYVSIKQFKKINTMETWDQILRDNETTVVIDRL